MDQYRCHMLIAFTLAVLLVGFGVLLSPPLRWLRTSLGLPADLPGARHSDGHAEIISQDPSGAKLFLARIAHVYHSVFIVLIYATLTLLLKLYMNKEGRDILALILIGVLMTIGGGITYSYIRHTFFWHGLFIAGLAIVFSGGLLILIRFRPKDLLGWAIMLTGVLIIGGALIGGWVGSSYIDRDVAQGFLNAKISSRFNPDLGEENVVWRAWTGHQHAMIALSLTLAFLISVKVVGVKKDRLAKASLYAVMLGTLVMALASYSVWPIGKVAHLAITPAALLLISGTLLLSFKTQGHPLNTPKGVLNWGLRLGNIWTWLFVAIPGAIVAVSLRKPVFFNPPLRNSVWDWTELAFNIGHWHILLTLWGVTVMLAYLTYTEKNLKLIAISGWISLIGLLISTAAINLYMLANPPQNYAPNPYNNIWLSTLVEPGLTIMSIGIAMAYILFLISSWKKC